jgi:teichoic acid glycerol-phosphate primase
MLREIVIGIYLWLVTCAFQLFNGCSQKNKVTFIVSFEENFLFLYQELVKQGVPAEAVILCKRSIFKDLKSRIESETTIIPFETPNIIDWFKSLYHLSTSKVIIIDNYFALLSAISFKHKVECIQIWHAAGALKTFGLEDKSVVTRSKAAQKRFKRVYDRFDKVVVGCEEMADIFIESFDLIPEKILRTGIPRTDFFYQEKLLEQSKEALEKKYPIMAGKKRILYAPTFRDQQLEEYDVKLDIERMYHTLKDDYLLLIKLHPAVKTRLPYQEMYPDFVIDFSHQKSINEILVIADYLISDYSSVPFEYSLLKKPMIFFAYDLQEYQNERGVIQDYTKKVPGSVAFTSEEVIQLLLEDKLEAGAEFAAKWHTYSDGNSSKKLVDYIKKRIAAT